jgi:hypothetical protein
MTTTQPAQHQAKWQVANLAQNDGSRQVVQSCDAYLKSAEARRLQIDPLLLWTLKRREVIDPVAEIIVDALPYTKVCELEEIIPYSSCNIIFFLRPLRSAQLAPLFTHQSIYTLAHPPIRTPAHPPMRTLTA